MKKKPAPISPTPLRRQAEAQWRARQKTKSPAPPAEADTLRLVHELEVHQIELEMQNTELAQTRVALEAALGQYTDLYDFAPVGYFTLTGTGVIEQVNLTGAKLLGEPRSALLKRRLGVFVAPAALPTFNTFLEHVFSTPEEGPPTCEVELREARWVQIQATRAADGQTCGAVLLDVTARKQIEEALRQAHVELEQRVQERTAELTQANAALQANLAERQQTERALYAAHGAVTWERNRLLAIMDALPVGVVIINPLRNAN